MRATPDYTPATKPRRGRAKRKTSAAGKRGHRLFLPLFFLVFMVLPGAASIWFWTAFASDRYIAETGFTVRQMEGGTTLDLFGTLTGIPGNSSTLSDSYVVLAFLESRELVTRLDSQFDLRRIFSVAEADPVFRLKPGATVEDLVDYWQARMHASYDSTSGILRFHVETFRAEDALLLSNAVLEEVEALVNRLSESARNDSLQNARTELEAAELRLGQATEAVRRFREAHLEIDPGATAEKDLQRVSALEAELAQKKVQLANLDGVVRPDALLVRRLNVEIESLKGQIEAERAARGEAAGAAALTALLSEYENLQLEQNFAQKAYTSAMASIEQARGMADSRQRYLAVYTAPARPEIATRPRRAINSVVSVIFIFAGWSVLTLLGYATRDHLS